MILLLSDLHGRFALVNEQIAHAEATTGRAVDEVIVLGDFGLFAEPLHEFFVRRGGVFARPVRFLEGNHEEFARFDDLLASHAGRFRHIPRGSLLPLSGRNCLAVGGAGYMDARNTPRGAEITERDIDRALAHPPDAVDCILTHDCPEGIGVPNSPGLGFYGPTGFPGSLRLLERYRPALWLFGHHHKWFELERDGTRFIGLAESWQGYALLHPGGRVETVRHEVAAADSLWRRMLASWFGT